MRAPTRSPAPDAARAARDALAALARCGSARRAAGARRYFKETVRAFGVPAPVLRRLAGETARRMRGAWTVEDAVRFCDRMIRDARLEAKAFGLLVLERFGEDLTRAHLPAIERWIEKHAANWATVDEIGPHVVGPLLDRDPSVKRRVIAWSRSPSPWMRRASAVSFVLHARRGRHLDEAYRVAERLFPCPEDLVHKATGWLLREAGRTDPARLEAFLLRHGPRVPRTALRYAIERFGAAERKRLLAATRGLSLNLNTSP